MFNNQRDFSLGKYQKFFYGTMRYCEKQREDIQNTTKWQMGLVPQYTRHISQTNIHVCFVDAVFFGSGYFNLGIRTHLEAHMYTVHPYVM